MQNILIETVPQRKQKYLTVGNYFERDKKLVIQVSEMAYRSEAAVAVHELVERILCFWQGIEDDAITRFDVAWEKNRKKKRYDEPGDDPKAPYHQPHKLAKRIERMVVEAMGLRWVDHNTILENTFNSDPRSH